MRYCGFGGKLGQAIYMPGNARVTPETLCILSPGGGGVAVLTNSFDPGFHVVPRSLESRNYTARRVHLQAQVGWDPSLGVKGLGSTSSDEVGLSIQQRFPK